MKKILLTLCASLMSHFLLGQILIDEQLPINDSLKKELEMSEDKLETLRLFALVHQDINLDSTIYFGDIFVSMADKLDDKTRLLDALAIVSQAHTFKGNLPLALELGLRAEQIQEENPWLVSNTKLPGIGPTYFSLSEIYYQIGDDEKLLIYANKHFELLENELAIGLGYYWKAKLFEKNNHLDSAMNYLLKSKEIIEVALEDNSRIDQYDFIPDWYNLLAKIYLKQEKPNLALTQFKNLLEIQINRGKKLHLAITYNDLAQFFSLQNKPDSSIYYANKGLEESQKIGYTKGELDAYTLLSENYDAIDPVNALHYYKLASSTQNSLYGAGNIQVLKDIINQREKEKEALEIAESNYQNRLKQYLLLSGLAALLLIAFILYRNMKRGRAANLILKNTLSNLKSTQSQLIQSEKMASLGELTAGIAHEIQNPLNFVNNFSEVSEELIEEVLGERSKEKGERNEELEGEILGDIKDNLSKINHHGERASSIVKGMLEHSQTSSGEKVPTDINALADEYLRLAYHGLRAKDKDFQSDFKTDFDENLPKVNMIPQDIGRVLLNLINNSFQAVTERSRSVAEVDKYQPLVTISTKLTDNSQLLIAIKDNGPGIPDSIKDKIFQPFFTTKPTGKGTGLGLSLAYDIVKAHGGELTVESGEEKGVLFTINLPV